MASGRLVQTVADFSLQRVLKKALFDHLNTSQQIVSLSGLVDASSIPLTLLNTADDVTYQSAIALTLAAITHQNPSLIAYQLAMALQTPQLPGAIAALQTAPTSTCDPSRPPSAGTRLSLTVSDVALTSWLQGLHRMPLPVAPPPVLPTVERLLKQQQWPLCQTLRLSLPMLLQWSRVRCGHWLDAPRRQGRQHWSPAAMDSPWTWSRNSPLACWELLQTLVYAVDTLAVQADDPVTFLRQGYAIAAAVYTFEARFLISTVPALASEVQGAIAGLLAAVQSVTALILLTTLGQSPVPTF
jgi:hypothetical protein